MQAAPEGAQLVQAIEMAPMSKGTAPPPIWGRASMSTGPAPSPIRGQVLQTNLVSAEKALRVEVWEFKRAMAQAEQPKAGRAAQRLDGAVSSKVRGGIMHIKAQAMANGAPGVYKRAVPVRRV